MRIYSLFLGFFVFLTMVGFGQDKAPLTVKDIMKFNHIKNTVLSENGHWLAYGSSKDRGDGSGVVLSTDGKTNHRIPLASNPTISKQGQWTTFIQQHPLMDLEKAAKDKKDKLKSGLILINNLSGKTLEWKNIKSSALSDNEMFLARLAHKDKKKKEKSKKKPDTNIEKSKKDKKDQKKINKEKGTILTLRHLKNGKELELKDVIKYAFSPDSSILVYSIFAQDTTKNGLYILDLTKDLNTKSITPIDQRDLGIYKKFSFNEKGQKLAYLQGVFDTKSKNKHYDSHKLFVWDTHKKSNTAVDSQQPDWFISSDSPLNWSKDGSRLFFGLKPNSLKPKADKKESDDIYDIEKLRNKRTLDVWHGDDPLIKPHEKKQWKNKEKQTYSAVYYPKSKKIVQLASLKHPSMRFTENKHGAIVSSNLPYQKLMTWDGTYRDYYSVNLKTGKHKSILKKSQSTPQLSPSGRYAAYYKDKHIYLYDSKTNSHKNLSSQIKTTFGNEDHDRPAANLGYRMAGWIEKDIGFVVYDKYDIWVFPTDKKDKPYMITNGDGRMRHVIYRIINTDRDIVFFKADQSLLLSAYYDLEKHHGFYSAKIGSKSVKRLLEDKKRFRFIKKAKQSDTYLFSREDFKEYPDLWVSNATFSAPKKLTNENPQIDQFAWGNPELVEWDSMDGKKLQGVLIKPANYIKGKRYPVLIYYYRLFSQRMYHFNQMVLNHRPNFPFYTSNGYAVFLPDIHFDIETPGMAAFKSLIPGVQKIIDMGVADKDAIGLHGHSWSGYQTAYIITQTDMFAAAVAGAPVSNMTSAYSGIRLASGMARQFQYEKTQSRIGHTLWERRDLYIDNSPVFFADRINTPTLIQFGDNDGAVPWEQGIELYLAMRRLEKDVVFLQYHGEPHHLKKYPNKLDYTLKMKEYLDHYLKGEPAPDWITKGVPYTGSKK